MTAKHPVSEPGHGCPGSRHSSIRVAALQDSRASVPSLYSTFTPSHRGGGGSPLVCLHGFTGTWRVWELVLPALERRHDVLALTLPGHAGGPRIEGEMTGTMMAQYVERAMDDAGFETAHLVGNSLGGYLALQLAARGRARSVVALAPAGGWAPGDATGEETLRWFAEMHAGVKAAAPNAASLVATPGGRRQVSQALVERCEHIPHELLVHQMLGTASCPQLHEMIAFALRAGYPLDADRIACPVRVVWGTHDRILEWPSSAMRYRRDWLPHADWVELEGVGHCPQLDVPLETAQLILGATT
jgi:pimeloyl-ACP methyl ester carboxylesterase